MDEPEAIKPNADAIRARIDQYERRRAASTAFADPSGPQIVAVMRATERGELRDWGNLCDHILSGPDGWIASKFLLRAARVAQAEFRVKPGAKDEDAIVLARICDRALRGLPDYIATMLGILDATATGVSVHSTQWHTVDGLTLPAKLTPVHIRRFRYDDQWQLRLYEPHRFTGPDGLGEILAPGSWVVHQHVTRGCYPGSYGELRKLLRMWLFMNWTSLWRVNNMERFGTPLIGAKIPKNAKEETRANAELMLRQFANDHTAVYEEDVEIIIDAAGAASRAYENHDQFMAFARGYVTEQILGTSDATSPGDVGSNAAVNTRMGAFTDPLMIVDGAALAETIRRDLFHWIAYFNRHLFGGKIPALPEMSFDTADDEVRVDEGDREAEGGAPRAQVQVPGQAVIEATPEPATPTDQPVADAAFNGAQISSALDIVTKVAARELLRSQAIAMLPIFFPTITPDAAAGMLSTVGTDDPAQLATAASQPAPQPAPQQFAASRTVAERRRPLVAALRARR